MATNVLGLMDYVQQQGEKGRQQGLQNRFAQLAGQAYSAAPEQQNALVGQAVGVDPQAGMELGNQLGAINSSRQETAQAAEVDHMKKLGGASRYMAQALQSKNPAQIEGAWQAVRPYLGQLTGKEPPQQWDPSFEPGVYQAIAMTGGAPEQKGVVLSAGGQLRNPMTGELLADNPHTPAGPKPRAETWNQPVDEAGPNGKPIRVQYSNTGERRVVEGAAPAVKQGAGAAKKSDEQIKVALYTKGLADDAYAYAAAATGRTQDELRQMTPEQVAGLVGQGSRWSSGPVVGRIPGMSPLANADLSAYANSASGKMARMNNPTGPVSNADFEIAAKSVWGPDKPDDVNAQLILNALQREQAMQAGGAAAPNTDTPAPAPAPAVAPRPRATNPQTGETVEFDGQQWVPVHG